MPNASAIEPYRVDVHHHFAPPSYIAEVGAQRKIEAPARNWTVAQSLDDMDRAGVLTAMLSITVPGLWFGDDAATRRITRACNDYAAELRQNHPRRFGTFASLPLPDIESSLLEVEYALDTLKAEGIGMFTSYGDAWLGDPSFEPLFAELNRRKAVVLTHPFLNDRFRNLIPDVTAAVVEYGTDTTRAIAGFVFSGASTRYPDVRMIFSHAGGTMPFLVERFVNNAEIPHVGARLPKGVLHELKRFYYDTAQSANPAAMKCLKELVSDSQILFGTDYPYRTAEKHVTGLRKCGFDQADLLAIEQRNAVALIPTLEAGRKAAQAR